MITFNGHHETAIWTVASPVHWNRFPIAELYWRCSSSYYITRAHKQHFIFFSFLFFFFSHNLENATWIYAWSYLTGHVALIYCPI